MVKIFKSIVTLRHVLLYYYKMVGGMTDFTGGGLFGMRDVVVPAWRKKTVSAEGLRSKYVKQALGSMSKPTFLQDVLGKEYITMLIDKAVSILYREAEQEGPQTAEAPEALGSPCLVI